VARCRAAQEKGGLRGAKARAPDQPVRLRSRPADLPEQGCDGIARKWNFYFHTNPGGCFLNAFEDAEGPLVLDRATGLLWWRPGSGTVSLAGARKEVAALDARKANGFADWRLPTTEELLSLLQSLSIRSSHLQPLLLAEGPEWWTSDRWPKQKAVWIVGSVRGSCRPALAADSEEEAGLLVVRTAGGK
jgi:hypothetical protein